MPARPGIRINGENLNSALAKKGVGIKFLASRERGPNRVDIKTAHRASNGLTVSENSARKMAASVDLPVDEILHTDQHIVDRDIFQEPPAIALTLFPRELLIPVAYLANREWMMPLESDEGLFVTADKFNMDQELDSAYDISSPSDWSEMDRPPVRFVNTQTVAKRCSGYELKNIHRRHFTPLFLGPTADQSPDFSESERQIYNDSRPLFRKLGELKLQDEDIETLTQLEAMIESQSEISELGNYKRSTGGTLSDFIEAESVQSKFDTILDNLAKHQLGLVWGQVASWALGKKGSTFVASRWRRSVLILVPDRVKEVLIEYRSLAIERKLAGNDLIFDPLG